MDKQFNSLIKDFRSLNQKPQMGLFYGERVRFTQEQDKTQKEAKKIVKRFEDYMSLCMLKQRGYVVVNSLHNPVYEELQTEQNSLNINPISMDHIIYIEQNTADKQDENEFYTPMLQGLMGASDGIIYIFDPLMIEGVRIQRFNDEANLPHFKKKRPEIVKWVEPIGKQMANKFAVCWDDGTIYIYDKELICDPKEKYNQAIVQTRSNNGQEPGKRNYCSKSDIVLKMQELVEGFDFDKIYSSSGLHEALENCDTRTCVFD